MSQDKTDYRKNFKTKKPSFPVAEISLPIPALGEDYTFDCKARRIDLASLIYNKALPQSMALLLLGDNNNQYGDLKNALDQAQKDAAKMSGKDTLDVLDFMWDMAKKICVEPILIDGTEEDENEGEIALRACEGSAHIIQAIYQYGMNMSPALPVKLTDGQETSVPKVERFHPFPQFPRDVRDVA